MGLCLCGRPASGSCLKTIQYSDLLSIVLYLQLLCEPMVWGLPGSVKHRDLQLLYTVYIFFVRVVEVIISRYQLYYI